MSCSKMRECKKKKRPFSPFPPISSAISGFFKIMIGYFRDALFIPPKFARTLGGVANKNFYLEDCAGNCWMVKLREIDDGSLVFEEGWRDFVLNHSISVGEIVVFKHISIAVFTVQIYGTSGCERVEFQGKENGFNLKRKRPKNEITPNILCQSKAQKRYETSDGKHNASVKESSKKDGVEKTFPCCLAGNETAARKYVTKSARERTYSLEESPPHDDGHRKLRNSSTMSHLEAPNKIIDQGKKIEESGRNSPIVLSDDDEEMDETIMIKDYSYVDKSNMGAKSSAKEHFKNRKENLAVDKRSANRCFLTTERKSSMMHKEVMEMTPSASVYPGTSQIKHNSRCTNISAANEGKMSVCEKAVAVEHNKDRKEGVAACNKSNNRCLSALDKKNSVIDKISVCKHEVIEITPFTLAPPQILETRSSQDANRFEVNEENTSLESNSPKSPKTVSAKDCTKVENRIKIENKCEIVARPLADERLPMIGCSQGQNIAVEGQVANDKIIRNNGSEPEEFTNNLHDEEFVGNSYGRPKGATPEFSDDEDGNLVSKEFARNALVMGEGVCYIAVHDSENKLEANVDVPVSMHTEDRGQNLILDEEFAQNPLNERMPMVDCSQGQNIAAEGQMANDKTIRDNRSEPEEFTNNLDDEEFTGNSYGKPEGLTPEFVEDEDGNVVSNEFSCKSLVMGEGMCYDAAQDSKDILGVNVDDSIGLHAEDEAKKLILAEEFTRNCLVMGEGSCYPVDENSKDKLEERIDSYIDLGTEDEGGNLIVPKEDVSKSFVRGEDICGIADNSKDELETRIDASIDLHAAKGECNVLDADEVEVITKRSSLHKNNPELPSTTPLLSYNVDSQGNLPPPCKGIINCDRSEGNLGYDADPSQATTVKRSPPLVMAVVSDFPKDPTNMEGDPLPSGIIPGELPEMDAEKVDPCSQGVLAVVKTEIMNSIDFPSLKNVEFCTTVSLVSQSWLLLPEKLPTHLFKKRCLRKVVLLQDPSMNLWPVLYHEGFNFIGFVGGWEDFSIANNLQQGDTCQIEYVSASEPTFKVQLSNVHNST